MNINSILSNKSEKSTSYQINKMMDFVVPVLDSIKLHFYIQMYIRILMYKKNKFSMNIFIPTISNIKSEYYKAYVKQFK